MDILDLGMIDFREFLRIQAQYVHRRIEGCISDTMLLAEHPLTVSFNAHNADAQLPFLRESREWFYARRIPIVGITRGGSLAVHAPGILGCYFVVQLASSLEVGQFLKTLESFAIDVLCILGVSACRLPDNFRDPSHKARYMGVWVERRKIVAVGIRVTRKTTSFGINFHISPEEWILRLIHPCSIAEYELTSLALGGCRNNVREVAATIREIAPKYFEK